jgi:hypothetical protein
MSYKYSAKNQAKSERTGSMPNEKKERPITFSNDSFPVLINAESVNFKPMTVWDSSVSLSEKLKEVPVAEENLIVQPTVFPNMRVRIIDNPNLQPAIDENHPTLKLLERLEDLRVARIERDRLKAIELKAWRKADELDDDYHDLESINESLYYNDSISDIYSEHLIPDHMSNDSEDVE